ncbi:MAG TPA: hypothetical protein VGN26_12565 [Armatimonadota bacterium]|jgi:hypothetical protein
MIGDIGLMVGVYVVVRLLAMMLGQENGQEHPVVRVASVLAGIVALACLVSVLSSGVQNVKLLERLTVPPETSARPSRMEAEVPFLSALPPNLTAPPELSPERTEAPVEGATDPTWLRFGDILRVKTPRGGGVNVRVAPDNASQMARPTSHVSDGEDILVLQAVGDWIEGCLPDDNQGWIRWRYKGVVYGTKLSERQSREVRKGH